MAKKKRYKVVIKLCKRFAFFGALTYRVVGSSFRMDGPMLESKLQKKHFTAFPLDFPQQRVGQASLGPSNYYNSDLPKMTLKVHWLQRDID